jgi:Leucine-rich repeat (LRR) protein
MSLWYVWRKPSTNLAPRLTLSQNRSKRDSTRPTSPRSSIIASNSISEPTVRLTQTVHQSCIKSSSLQTDRTELPLEPRHLGVPSCASKMISMPMVCSVQAVQLSYTDTNTVSKWTKTRFHMTHSLTSSIRCIVNYLWASSLQTMHLSGNKISTISKRTEQRSTRPSSPRSTIGCI